MVDVVGLGVGRRHRASGEAAHPIPALHRTAHGGLDQTIADAQALMTAERVESAPGAHDGVVVLVSLLPGSTRHGTAAIYAGAALLDGRPPGGTAADPRRRDGAVRRCRRGAAAV
jgi:hypothetical protein